MFSRLQTWPGLVQGDVDNSVMNVMESQNNILSSVSKHCVNIGEAGVEPSQGFTMYRLLVLLLINDLVWKLTCSCNHYFSICVLCVDFFVITAAERSIIPSTCMKASSLSVTPVEREGKIQR